MKIFMRKAYCGEHELANGSQVHLSHYYSSLLIEVNDIELHQPLDIRWFPTPLFPSGPKCN